MADGTPGNGLVRALLLGLLAGAIVLALIVAAYAIGRDQGSDAEGSATTTTAPGPATTATAPAPATTAAAPGAAAAPAPALIATGRELYASAGCMGCHSLDGSPGVGPSLQDLAGRQVTLTDGQEVVADEAYVTEAIAEPDARVVEGYSAGTMPDLGLGDAEIAALVAFLRSQ
jgi:mono/diheme cytochrome c family protein